MAVAGVGFPDCADEDAPLVRRCRKGDVGAYRVLVDRHERRVMSILARILPSRQAGFDTHSLSDVEDLAQEVFLLAWRALPSFRGDARFSTWLYRIATNRAIKEWRRAQRVPGRGWSEGGVDGERDPVAPGDVAAQHRDPETLIQIGIRDEQLRAAVDALPEKQRVVILLHYFEEYSCEEIAELLNCSIGTIWSRLHYGCRKLRSSLDAIEIG
jgi:RNA polymerase sigma-70 factor (ECF subfamily)